MKDNHWAFLSNLSSALLATFVASVNVAGGATRHECGAVETIWAEHVLAAPAELGTRQVKPLHGRPAHWHNLLPLIIQCPDCLTIPIRGCKAVITIARVAACSSTAMAAIFAQHHAAARTLWGAAAAIAPARVPPGVTASRARSFHVVTIGTNFDVAAHTPGHADVGSIYAAGAVFQLAARAGLHVVGACSAQLFIT